MILRTYVVFSPRTPLLFLLTSKWLIYKVESYDEVQNLKSCTFSLRSSSPLNEEARKAWLGTTTNNVSLSLWAGSAFLIALLNSLPYNAIIHHFLSYLLRILDSEPRRSTDSLLTPSLRRLTSHTGLVSCNK